MDINDRATVLRWIDENARPLAAHDPDAPPADLEPLRDVARDATVVAMGTATRGAHEVFVLLHRGLRLLVGEMGFRTLAIEEDWTQGVRIDEWLRTGTGDPRELLGESWLPWQTREMLDTLLWLRAFNERHPGDPVRLLGVDITATRALAYDAVTEYVRRTAPDRLAELLDLYAPLRPDADGNIDEHVGRYRRTADKRPLIERAERAHRLVDGLDGGEGHAPAVRHAAAIVDFHVFHSFSHPITDSLAHVERRMADNLVWWHEHTGTKIVHWGGLAHTAVGDPIGNHGASRRNTGAHLRDRFGDGYVSVAVTIDHGAVHGGVPVPSPPETFADAPLGAAGPAHYLLDLRSPAPEAVREWLETPGKVRTIGPAYRPESDADHHSAGAVLRAWFDAVVHSQEVTSVHALPVGARAVTRARW
ncbi:erythromycin esterase family protein [Actinomadura sp. NPDC047616]|uniref:erythromycin esterase family protein n=1 Tax=Actinomadura sp. NPDC047616 TaxID=3155914 RepID=UPI0034015F01